MVATAQCFIQVLASGSISVNPNEPWSYLRDFWFHQKDRIPEILLSDLPDFTRLRLGSKERIPTDIQGRREYIVDR